MQQDIKFSEGVIQMTWFLLVLWFDITCADKQSTHRPIDWHIDNDILTPDATCMQQLPALHWVNNLLIQIFTLQRSTMSLLFKSSSLLKVIFLLIWFSKTKSFLWKTDNTDRNSVNDQNTQTTHRGKILYPTRQVHTRL